MASGIIQAYFGTAILYYSSEEALEMQSATLNFRLRISLECNWQHGASDGMYRFYHHQRALSSTEYIMQFCF